MLFRWTLWFPPRQRLLSASYTVGLNGGVAVVAMALLLGAVTWLYLMWRREQTELPPVFPLDDASAPPACRLYFFGLRVFRPVDGSQRRTGAISLPVREPTIRSPRGHMGSLGPRPHGMLGWRSCRDSNAVVWEYPALIRRGSRLRARLAGR